MKNNTFNGFSERLILGVKDTRDDVQETWRTIRWA